MERYNILDTKEKLADFDKIVSQYDTISLDTETNGLLLYKTVVIGFSISVNSKSGIYVPILSWVPDESSKKIRRIKGVPHEFMPKGHFINIWSGDVYDERVTPNTFKPPSFITDYLKKWTDKKNIILHNAPFDVNQIYVNFGIDLADQVFMDTTLLAHIINENTPNGLKRVADEWREELGINPHAMANQEQIELKMSVIKNGGKSGHEVWRANPYYLGKYAAADTFLTYGLYEVGMKKFIKDFGEDMLPWLLTEEVMPLCREVVIPMKRKGVYLDTKHFERLRVETSAMLLQLEDEIIKEISPHFDDFSLSESYEDAISNKRLIEAIIKKENLTAPINEKTGKPTLAKGAIKKRYQEDPHWIWGYILGEDEIKYSEAELHKIKSELYHQVYNRRYRFNIGSDAHLRWLFFDKLGMKKDGHPTTDSGALSVKADILKDLMLDKFPWVIKLMTFKRLRKFYTSYILPALELNIDGYLYMDFRQNGTTSGRFSCSGGFNLQTLPRVEEIDICPNCGSSHVVIDKPIDLFCHITCSDCGHAQQYVICPSAIKEGFITPPGYKIVNADFSSLEPRCFAFMSGDDKLKQVYWDNLDLYSKVYCDMEGIEYKDLKKSGMKKERNLIKPVVLGIPYGARGPQVANLMGLLKSNGRLNVDLGWTKRNQYLNTYAALRVYMDKQDLDAISKGHTSSLIGRRRHFKHAPFIYLMLSQMGMTVDEFLDFQKRRLERPNVNSMMNKERLQIFCDKFKYKYDDVVEKGAWSYVRGFLRNELNNSKNQPIQALAAHITNRAMLETTRLYKEKGVDGYVCIQVHDEIGCYVKEEQSELGADLLRQGMEHNKYAKMIDVPMIADPIICDNIKEAK